MTLFLPKYWNRSHKIHLLWHYSSPSIETGHTKYIYCDIIPPQVLNPVTQNTFTVIIFLPKYWNRSHKIHLLWHYSSPSIETGHTKYIYCDIIPPQILKPVTQNTFTVTLFLPKYWIRSHKIPLLWHYSSPSIETSHTKYIYCDIIPPQVLKPVTQNTFTVTLFLPKYWIRSHKIPLLWHYSSPSIETGHTKYLYCDNIPPQVLKPVTQNTFTVTLFLPKYWNQSHKIHLLWHYSSPSIETGYTKYIYCDIIPPQVLKPLTQNTFTVIIFLPKFWNRSHKIPLLWHYSYPSIETGHTKYLYCDNIPPQVLKLVTQNTFTVTLFLPKYWIRSHKIPLLWHYSSPSIETGHTKYIYWDIIPPQVLNPVTQNTFTVIIFLPKYWNRSHKIHLLWHYSSPSIETAHIKYLYCDNIPPKVLKPVTKIPLLWHYSSPSIETGHTKYLYCDNIPPQVLKPLT